MNLESINIVLFDDLAWHNLLPITFTRPTAQIRVGITTIFEKWVLSLDLFKEEISFLTQNYLSTKYPIRLEESNLFINGSVLPNKVLTKAIANLKMDEILVNGSTVLAFKTNKTNKKELTDIINTPPKSQVVEFAHTFVKIQHLWDIFRYNGDAIKDDFKHLTSTSISFDYFNNNLIIGPEEDIFIAGENEIIGVSFNTTNGPIYIAPGAKIMEGALIRGPFAICENAVVKMGCKIYGGTTLGPHTKVGGELNNVVIQGYSNKGHEGYLGNAVIGEWCNIGADSNCSNLKNNYSEVKVWNYVQETFEQTNLQFCGLIMGDHSKCGINTMFNTATVVGVAANVFGQGFPPKHIPSFAWGNKDTFTTHLFNKATETAERMMSRRNLSLERLDIDILKYIYAATEKYRTWESINAPISQ